MEQQLFSSDKLRSFVFGVEDSLVSTIGLVSGIASVGMETKTILLTGTILIFVEAFSMAVGSFISENSAEEYKQQKDLSSRRAIPSGIVMFVSYFISGFIPLSPYLFSSGMNAVMLSIGASLLALFVLGFISGTLSRVRALKSAFQMLLIGGLAIGIGTAVGILLK